MSLAAIAFKTGLWLHKGHSRFPHHYEHHLVSRFSPFFARRRSFRCGHLHLVTRTTIAAPSIPPGPSPDPVIGNLRQMGSGNLEFVFEKWGKEYG